MSSFFAHETAIVSPNTQIGEGTKIWHFAHVRENVKIGKNCIIGQGVYIDSGVEIGDNCKIQNNATVYHGVTVEDGVFIGPHVCFTNDKYPRAIDEEGNLKSDSDWIVSETLVKKGTSIGANATILPGVTIGEFAMIGSGSLVSRNVPDFGLAIGNPAKIVGTVGKDGKITKRIQVTS